MAKDRKRLNNKIEPFDIVITDDKNFSKDNFSKGINRRLVVLSKNKKKGIIVVSKGHSLGNDPQTIEQRKLKEKKGYLKKMSDGTEEFYMENMPINHFSNGELIKDEYNIENKMFPSNRKIAPQYREKAYNHVYNNKKQKRQSIKNKKDLKKLKSNKRKKRGK